MEQTLKKKPPRRVIIAGVALIVLLGVGLYWLLHRGEESTDDAVIESRVTAVSPRVMGYVKAVHVEDNQVVKAGDVLAEIDPQDYQLRIDRAQASLNAANARLEASRRSLESTRVSAPSGVSSAQSQVEAARANWQRASQDLARLRAVDERARSRSQLDEAVAAERAAKAQLDDTLAKLKSAQTAPKTISAAEASTQELAANVELAQAELAVAQKDLADATITAPADGRITRRGIEPGAYVQPGQQLFAFVGTEMWVVANFKETQLRYMKPGQKVRIEVDAFPGRDFTGTVDSIQTGTGARFSLFPPENATGNFVKIIQRVPVKITFDTAPDASIPLGPGMSVVPTVHTR